jgi:flagellar biosynthesis chaperone FliJ
VKPQDLAALVRVSGAISDAAEARLATLRREETDLRDQIAALEAARQARATEARATDLTVRAGVDLRWEGWIDRRASALAAELARLRARIEIARDELAQAFGRRTATEALSTRAQVEAAARRAKREERNA